jgi:glutaredoxin
MLVKIYGMKDCSWCDKAVSLAEAYELPYVYEVLDEDFDFIEFSQLFPGAKTFPQIVINDDHIGGYRDFEEVMEIASE